MHPDSVAMMESAATQRFGSNRTSTLSASVGDYVDVAGHLEHELIIGHADVFLEIREGKGRTAPLRIDGNQHLKRECFWLDDKRQRLVFWLAALRCQLQRDRTGLGLGDIIER